MIPPWMQHAILLQEFIVYAESHKKGTDLPTLPGKTCLNVDLV